MVYMQNQTMQSIFILLNKKRGKCVLKTERIKPTVMYYEFEEKLQKANKPANCQSMLLSRTERNRGFFQIEILTHFTRVQNPVQIGSPQNCQSCLLMLRALHHNSIQNFMAQKSHEKQKSVNSLLG